MKIWTGSVQQRRTYFHSTHQIYVRSKISADPPGAAVHRQLVALFVCLTPCFRMFLFFEVIDFFDHGVYFLFKDSHTLDVGGAQLILSYSITAVSNESIEEVVYGLP